MANLGKPQKAKTGKKGLPPTLDEGVTRNLDKRASNETAQLKFGVSPEFQKEYKRFALDNDFQSMKEVLEKSFELIKDKYQSLKGSNPNP